MSDQLLRRWRSGLMPRSEKSRPVIPGGFFYA
jgi:hypothetical protein